MTKARSSVRTAHTEFLTNALCTAFGAVWLSSIPLLAVVGAFAH